MKNLWRETVTVEPAVTEAEKESHFDTLVVGAGYTGCSLALSLSEKGHKVGVFEAKELGHGCSGKNSGNLNPGLWLKPSDVEKSLGAVWAQRLNTALRDGPSLVEKLVQKHAIDCDLNDSGTLHCAANDKGVRELEGRVKELAAQGFDVSLCDAAETRKLVGSDHYRACIHNKSAYSIQPYAYLLGLANAAVAAGASLSTNNPVVSATRQNGQWVVQTAKGEFTAKWLVVATDAYHKQLNVGAEKDMVRIWYFNFATDPLSSEFDQFLPGAQGCWDTRYLMTSFTRDRDGRLVVGGVGRLEGISKSVHRNWALRAKEKVFPGTSKYPFTYGWHGSIGMTPNGIPRIKNLGENALSVYGYSGRGIAPATVFGHALARYIDTGDKDCLPVDIGAPKGLHFKPLRELYYNVGSTLYNTVMP